MTEEEAWDKITRITNKDSVSKADIRKIREFKQFLQEEQQLWVEEALFLIEGSK